MKIIWKISTNGDGTATLAGYELDGAVPAGEITLPTKVSGNTITRVNCNLGNKVTKLVIPGSIKEVLDIASDNLSLREVVIQEGVERLGWYSYAYEHRSFGGCKNLNKVQIPKSMKIIDTRCFYNCESLKSISLPEGLTRIGEDAFENSGLQEVTIPSTVTELGGGAFSNADLEEITVKCGENGWSFGGGYGTFAYCEKLEKVKLNENTNYIANQMFKGCTALKTITLPKNLTEIGWEAFKGCTNLERISIPSNVTAIADSAFYGCTSMKKVTILGSITEIQSWTFQNCTSLEAIFIPMTVNTIEGNAFDGCVNLQDVYYPMSESAWANISIYGDGNGFLTAADLHTNALPLVI